MTQEEKAKAYDEALDRAKKWKEMSGMPKDKQGILDNIFPELKDVGDERVRKNLIELFHDVVSNDEIFSDYGLDKTEVLAWLEKQNLIMAKSPQLGEQKPADKVEPKFKVGDVVCDKSCTTLDKDAQPNYKIIDIKNGLYICEKGVIPIEHQDEFEWRYADRIR